MISNDCRCPGCGTCEAAAEVVPLRIATKELRKANKEEKQKYAELLRMTQSYVKTLHAAEAERDNLKLALQNVAMLAKRLRKTDPENAEHLLRFCREAGWEDSILREGGTEDAKQ